MICGVQITTNLSWHSSNAVRFQGPTTCKDKTSDRLVDRLLETWRVREFALKTMPFQVALLSLATRDRVRYGTTAKYHKMKEPMDSVEEVWTFEFASLESAVPECTL